MNVNLKSLIDRLNETTRTALEAAAGLCLSRTNYDVEIEHLLLKLLDAEDTDALRIFRKFEVNDSHLRRDLAAALDRLKTGNARTPALSPQIPKLIERAWLLASVEYGASKVRSGHLILALIGNPEHARLAREISREFARISAEQLAAKITEITAGSAESRVEQSAPPTESEAITPTGKTKALDQFTIDLTARARAGQIDAVLGRDFEIRQIVDILMRRRQNNPILTGEAGVGKTAVVEGFALRIAEGDVPPPLRNVAVKTLDLGLLQAGAGIKGEFENRLKTVIEEVKSSPQPIILFIDEAHTMIGAGAQAGQSDAANLLKPALARGELRTIAATTWAEYKKYFEKDAALARRFQVVKVEEPDEAQCIIMMRGITHLLEKHHGVRILDEAIEDTVKLSHRYISGRQLPDKAVSVLDTACARVAIGQSAQPPEIEAARRTIDQLTLEIGSLEREAISGASNAARIETLNSAKASATERLSLLTSQWDRERSLVEKIRDTRTRLEEEATRVSQSIDPAAETTVSAISGSAGTALSPALDAEALRAELKQLTFELEKIQGETPLVQVCVNSQAIAEVISGWTGIPVGRMMTNEINTVLSLEDRLGQRVIGQSYALASICQRIRTSRANLTDPRRPVGVFLLIGPSGVGKTESALALAEALYGGERNLISINMSEYQEAHTVSGLKGSPPGYVGYGEGGVLTEAVRRKPYSVVLLDEAEKAHTDVMELFYQVFDKGMLEDGEGREIDFKNTLILLTSNSGTDTIMKLSADPETQPEPDALLEILRPDLLKVFKPALLGRMIVVPYYPITDEVMRDIIRLQLGRVGERVKKNHGAAFSYSEDLVNEIASRCTEVESGARNVDHILTGTLLPEMAGEFLSRMASGSEVRNVRVSVGEGGRFAYEIS